MQNSYCHTAMEAVSLVESGHRVFIQTATATPQQLVLALSERGKSLQNVSIYHMHTEGLAPYADEGMQEHFNVNCFFVGANLRKAVNSGRANYIPVFLSEVPLLFRRKIIPIDVALLHVSPPDEHGFCSLGTSVDVALAAIENAKFLIAQVNPNMPRTHGGGMIHFSRIHKALWVEDPIFEHLCGEPDEVDMQIADHVADLVEDGACLQMGIGSIPNAVLSKLSSHKHLGVHSEMFSDGIIPLLESGVIDGSKKKKHPGKVIGGFVLGSKKLYSFIDDNPLVELHDAAYVNDPYVIAKNPQVTAINSAIEVDVSGQICADSIGSNIYSGVGGQMDFIRAAALSENGKPIIALRSCTSSGKSKIVSGLTPGAGVVTTRAHAHFVVTEYGTASLFGKNLKERLRALIDIAHPLHRESLEREARELWKISC